MKEVTFEEAKNLLAEIGHQANVTVPVDVYPDGTEYSKETVMNCVLNNAIVYNPYKGGQVGMSSNEKMPKVP